MLDTVACSSMLSKQSVACAFFLTVLLISDANDPPSVQPFHFPGNVTTGQSVTVVCAVTSGSSPLNFQWTKDGQPLLDHPLTRVQTTDDISLLSLKSVDKEREGNYTCSVSNAYGNENYKAHLHVFEYPEWKIQPKDSEVVLGGALSVHCSAGGDPEPHIMWRRSDGTKFHPLSTGGRHVLASNGTLLISDIEQQDNGNYECHVTNGIGEGLSKVINIRVRVPPQFKENYQLLKIRNGHSVVLQCDVTGEIPMMVNWSKDQRSAIHESRHKIQETPLPNGLLSELHVPRVTKQDAGLYTCVARNSYGVQERTIKLVVLEPPASPSDITVKQLASREVTVRWTAPYSGNSPVSRYVLQYWKDTGSPPKLEEETIPGERATAVIKQLHPGTSYVVRVLAENEFGSSTPSVPIKFVTAEDNPTGSPIDVSVFPRGAHALVVRWKAPPPDQWNGAIQGYQLGYRIKQTHPYESRDVVFNSGGAQEYVLSKLKENTDYEVVLRAYNGAGRGPSSVPVVARTRDSVQLIPPVIWVDSTSSSTILLRWSGNEAINDYITHHSLHYRAEGNPWKELIISGPSPDSYLLSGLEEDTTYQVYIQAVSGTEFSSPSQVLVTRTSDPRLLKSSLTQEADGSNQTTLIISLSVVISSVLIVCVIAGACVYVTRVTSHLSNKADELNLTEQQQPSSSGSTPLSQTTNFRYVDVNSRPLLWCSTPAPPNDYPSPYATLPLRSVPIAKRWQSDERLSSSERSESLVSQRVELPEEKPPSVHD